MSVSELGTVMTEMGQPQTDEQLKEMIKKYDLDENGSINFREFHKMMGWTDPVDTIKPAPAPAPIGGNTPTPTPAVTPAPAPAPIGGNTPTP